MKRGYILKNLKTGMFYSFDSNKDSWTNKAEDAFMFNEINLEDIEKMVDENFLKHAICEIILITKGKMYD